MNDDELATLAQSLTKKLDEARERILKQQGILDEVAQWVKCALPVNLENNTTERKWLVELVKLLIEKGYIKV